MQSTVATKLHNIAPKYCPLLYVQGHQRTGSRDKFIYQGVVYRQFYVETRYAQCVCVFIIGVRNPSYNLGSVRVWHSALCRCIMRMVYIVRLYYLYYYIHSDHSGLRPVGPRTILNPYFLSKT